MGKHPIPDDALDDRLAGVGTSGSGKTYNLGTAIERALDLGRRVGVVDPLGVWWGLRLLADGKKASPWPIVIFGGPHGDLPLSENAGQLIGETCATMSESFILDLSELGTRSAERRFMLAFYTALYRRPTSSHFQNSVSALRTAGLVEYPAGGRVSLTDSGLAIAGAAAHGTVRERLAGILSALQGRMIDALPRDGSPLTKAELAAAIGQSPTSSHFQNTVSSLRTLSIVTYPDRGSVAIEPWVWVS